MTYHKTWNWRDFKQYEEKILGVYFDNKLNFNTHIKNFAKKLAKNYMQWQDCLILWVLDKEKLLWMHLLSI